MDNSIMDDYIKEYKKRSFRRRRFFFLHPLMIVFLFGFGAIVMLLWNAILPDLLGVKMIGYWQSLGLLILCKILFGGSHFGRHKFGPGRHKWYRARLRQKLAYMTDEEREKFRQEWRKHFRDKYNR